MNFLTIISLISSVIAVCVSLILGIDALRHYFRDRRDLLLWLAVLGFSFTYELATIIDFFFLLADGVNIPFDLAGILTYGFQPISVISGVYLGSAIFFPRKKNQFLAFTCSLALIHYVSLLGFTEIMISGEISTIDNLVYVSPDSILLVLIIVYLLIAIFFLARKFYMLSRGAEGKEKLYLQRLALGWILFSIGAVLGSVSQGYWTIAGRFIMIASYITLYRGFLPKAHINNKDDPDRSTGG